MKRKFLLSLIVIAIALVAFGAISASAARSGIYTYSVIGAYATITDCDTSVSGDITIPSMLGGYMVTTIGSAFSGCNSLVSVTIPGSVKQIGKSAFNGCSSLENINIPDSVKLIDQYAFQGCSSLESITIPDSVTNIGSCAFYNCSSLESITIGDSVTSIGTYAFSDCSSLKSITIPDRVTTIGHYAFRRCSSLTSITIGNSVTSIGAYAFSGCNNLTSVYYKGTNAQWIEISFGDGNTHFATSNIVYNYKTILDCLTYTITYGKVTITDCATSIVGDWGIPATIEGYPVTSVGDRAFNDCSNLTSITIPDSVTSIGANAFSGCSSLESISIPRFVTSIGANAFSDCNLKKVYVYDIAAWCNISFDDSTANPLYYAHNLYLNENPVSNLIIPDGVKNIGDYAFQGCNSLVSVTISDSVTNIGNCAFDGCNNLADVYYDGTETDWTNITIGRSNSCLTNAKIHFIPYTRTNCSSNGKSFTITPIGVGNGKIVILALYDGEKFVEMQSAVYTGEAIPFTTTKAYTKAKVFVWDDWKTLRPICEAEIVK